MHAVSQRAASGCSASGKTSGCYPHHVEGASKRPARCSITLLPIQVAMESASCAARRAVASLRRDQNRSGVSRTVCAVRAPVRAAGGLSTSRSAPGCSGSRRMQLRVASPGGMSLEKQRQQGSRRPLTAVHAIPPSAEEVFNFENIVRPPPLVEALPHSFAPFSPSQS